MSFFPTHPTHSEYEASFVSVELHTALESSLYNKFVVASDTPPPTLEDPSSPRLFMRGVRTLALPPVMSETSLDQGIIIFARTLLVSNLFLSSTLFLFLHS